MKYNKYFAIFALLSNTASAGLYFDPGFVSNDPEVVEIIENLKNADQQPPGDYMVDIYVNKKFFARETVRFIAATEPARPETVVNMLPDKAARDASGLDACFSAKKLESFGVMLSSLNPEEHHQSDCLLLPSIIPYATTSLHINTLTLDISIPQAFLSGKMQSSPHKWDKGINAAIFNYDINGSKNNNGDSSYAINLMSGLNIGAWRLRDYRSQYYYDNHSYKQKELIHLRTYAQRSIDSMRSRLTLGDNISDGVILESFNYRGFQLKTDEEMYPDELRGYAPKINGVAYSNARVTIKQNNSVIYQINVPPGPFVINDLYAISSNGDIVVTVTEANGSEHVFSVPYASLPILQRNGVIKYNLTAGRLNNKGKQYDNPKFMQGTAVLGLPHNMTVFGGLQIAERYKSYTLGLGMNAGKLGAFSVDVTQAHSRLLREQTARTGSSYRFLYSNKISPVGTTMQVSGYRYSTSGYYTFPETALKYIQKQPTNAVAAYNRIHHYHDLTRKKKSRFDINLLQRISKNASLSLSVIRQSHWNSGDTIKSIQAALNGTLKHVNYNISYGINRFPGQRKRDKFLYISLSFPLDSLLPQFRNRPHPVRVEMNAINNNNDFTKQAKFAGTMLKENNLSWNLASNQSKRNGHGASIFANYKGNYGDVSAGYSLNRNQQQLSYGYSGGMVVHDGGLTFGKYLGENNVLISAPMAAGAKVENQTATSTNNRGYALISYVTPFRENRVSISTQSLSDNVDITNPVIKITPDRGALVKVSFDTIHGVRAIATLSNHGKPLPFGSIVNYRNRKFIVDDGGDVYISGLEKKGFMDVIWGKDKLCKVNYELSDDDMKKSFVRFNGDCY